MKESLSRSLAIPILWIATIACQSLTAQDPLNPGEFFEQHVRPILIENCLECHSAANEAAGGLMLDSKPNWELGGDSGDAIVPGHPDMSLLIKAIRYDDPDLQMPPDGKLPDQSIQVLKMWIETGAFDPRAEVTIGKPKQTGLKVEEAHLHWSYRPIDRNTSVPPTTEVMSSTPVDAFIDAALIERNLIAVNAANRTQLIRRLSFDLTGLPPTPSHITEFVQDDQPRAIDRLVERLMASPRFGETFARRWMDVSRFAESITLRGFVLPQAWRYRDYLVEAFNDDRPVDRMIVEQIAGDLLESRDIRERSKQLVATSFLALGNTNLEEQDKTQLEMDYIDEQLEVLGRAFLGQTLGCARCHDHKFDPIPTRDYYALAGIFRNTVAMEHSNVSAWIERPLPVEDEQEAEFASIKTKVENLTKQIASIKKRKEPAASAQASKDGKSFTPTDANGYVVDNLDAKFVGQWTYSSSVARFVGESYLHDQNSGKGEKTATFEPKDLPPGTYRVRISYSASDNRAANTKVVVFSAGGEETHRINQQQKPPIDDLWYELGTYRFEANGQAFVIISNEDTDGHVIADAIQFLSATDEPNRGLAKGQTIAQEVPGVDSAVTGNTASDENAKQAADLRDLEKQLTQLRDRLEERPTFLTIVEKTPATDIPIHIRGNVHSLGPVVPRGVLTALTLPDAPQPLFDEKSSGRLELARWIANEQNPLTARVYANRVWHWLVGQGIVPSTSNFGTTGDTPSHPQLLDWLASELIRSGWSTKHLVRCIVTSDAYQRAVAEPDVGAPESDPNNRYLWRANLRRLTAEELRDAMLVAAGELDGEIAGSGIKKNVKEDYNYTHQGTRRSLYHPVFRNSLPELFEVFDFADSSVSIGERSRSTVAPQALAMMNAPWIQARAVSLADQLIQSCSTAEMVTDEAFKRCIGRSPSVDEALRSIRFLNLNRNAAAQLDRDRVQQLVHSLFGSLDFRYLE
jgi:Protein of unknown function (DUF1553)/Protein of unknown function (DUF1549)/Planctomycete cytochrome C